MCGHSRLFCCLMYCIASSLTTGNFTCVIFLCLTMEKRDLLRRLCKLKKMVQKLQTVDSLGIWKIQIAPLNGLGSDFEHCSTLDQHFWSVFFLFSSSVKSLRLLSQTDPFHFVVVELTESFRSMNQNNNKNETNIHENLFRTTTREKNEKREKREKKKLSNK